MGLRLLFLVTGWLPERYKRPGPGKSFFTTESAKPPDNNKSTANRDDQDKSSPTKALFLILRILSLPEKKISSALTI
jgi:hypothetical protein